MARLKNDFKTVPQPELEAPPKKEETLTKQSYFQDKYKVIYTCKNCGNSYTLDAFDNVFSDRLLCTKDRNLMQYQVIKL